MAGTLVLAADGGADTSAARPPNQHECDHLAQELRRIAREAGVRCPLAAVVWWNSPPLMSKYNFVERLNCSINAAWSGKVLLKPTLAEARAILSAPEAEEGEEGHVATHRAAFASAAELRAYGGFGSAEHLRRHPKLVQMRRVSERVGANRRLAQRAMLESLRQFVSGEQVEHEEQLDALLEMDGSGGEAGVREARRCHSVRGVRFARLSKTACTSRLEISF